MLSRLLRKTFTPNLNNDIDTQNICPFISRHHNFSTSTLLRSFSEEKKLQGASMPRQWLDDFELLEIMLLKHYQPEALKNILFLVEVYEQIMLADLRNRHPDIKNTELSNNDVSNFKNKVIKKLETMKNTGFFNESMKEKPDSTELEQDHATCSLVNRS